VSAEAIARAFEADLPFIGLRDHEPDPDLDRVVPPGAARSARALPLFADDERVRVAVADPAADLGALSPYLEGRRVELVIAAREELDAVLGPPAAAQPPPPEPTAEEPVAAESATTRPPPADEQPSWLQTSRRRGRPVVRTVLVLLLLLLVAVGVGAYLLML
jgi:hypothetical protein